MKKLIGNQKKGNILRVSAATVLAFGLSACSMMHNDSEIIGGIPVTVPDGKTYHIRSLDMVEKDGILMVHGHVYNTDKHNVSSAEHIDIKIVRKLPVLNIDRFRLQQLFQNLIGNAIKFHSPMFMPLIFVVSFGFYLKTVA